MTNRVITINKVGPTANNVLYKDVLIGCFEDGDNDTLAMIMDRAIDTYIERRQPVVYELCEKLSELGYELGRKGQSKSELSTLVKIACQ